LGLFKSAVRAALGPDSAATRKILAVSRRVRLSIQRPLVAAPIPLLNPDQSLLVLWSAKSACSLTFVWYLNTIGLLEDFRATGMMPHEYRGMHYRTSDAFLRGQEKLLDDYFIVHVIRDPYLRAVSCFRHALAYPFADRHFRVFEGGGLDRRRGFSFSRYLDFLETVDLASANLHHRQQLHRIETIKPADRVINISTGDFLHALNRLEREVGMPRTDFANLGVELQREAGRAARTTRTSEVGVAD